MTELAPTLDARGLLCPLPVIRLQDAVRTLADGAQLEVIATDPGALHDISAWCRVHGHRVLESHGEKHEIRFRIEVRRQSREESSPTDAD